MARNIYFERTGTDDTYPGLSTYTYRIETEGLLNMTANSANEKYYQYIDGTSNMTTALNAYSFIAKGHYY